MKRLDDMIADIEHLLASSQDQKLLSHVHVSMLREMLREVANSGKDPDTTEMHIYELRIRLTRVLEQAYAQKGFEEGRFFGKRVVQILGFLKEVLYGSWNWKRLSADGQPPRVARFVLLMIPKRNREHLIGDLEEEYRMVVLPDYGRFWAWVWYWGQAIQAVGFYLWPFVKRALGMAAIWKLIGR